MAYNIKKYGIFSFPFLSGSATKSGNDRTYTADFFNNLLFIVKAFDIYLKNFFYFFRFLLKYEI